MVKNPGDSNFWASLTDVKDLMLKHGSSRLIVAMRLVLEMTCGLVKNSTTPLNISFRRAVKVWMIG